MPAPVVLIEGWSKRGKYRDYAENPSKRGEFFDTDDGYHDRILRYNGKRWEIWKQGELYQYSKDDKASQAFPPLGESWYDVLKKKDKPGYTLKLTAAGKKYFKAVKSSPHDVPEDPVAVLEGWRSVGTEKETKFRDYIADAAWPGEYFDKDAGCHDKVLRFCASKSRWEILKAGTLSYYSAGDDPHDPPLKDTWKQADKPGQPIRKGYLLRITEAGKKHFKNLAARELGMAAFAHSPPPAGAAALGHAAGKHPLFFQRPDPGPNTLVVSYQSTQIDMMWKICAKLKELGYDVFNGNQIKGGEEWDEVYFDEYLDQCSIGLCMLSEEYFNSEACADELRMLKSEHKKIIPLKLGIFKSPKLSLRRLLGNHIPGVKSTDPESFGDAFEENMKSLVASLDEHGAQKN